ncbi:ankyrin repeat domain-containing protein [Legionella feeleii]|uniref:Ankyrin repeats (3 copies) n=1 Tax=Legionella feeleii TaxID=453 RepID=A0A378IRH3_9GAMM|nr:ankyrin repeat domain-containing protein [Legionella feeleii]STX37836.1 Ankyrin repeats (3 copies) [Legionella feeleii]
MREIKKGHYSYEPIFLELMVQGKDSEEDVLYLIKDVVQTGHVELLAKVIEKIDGQQLLDFQNKYGRDFLNAAVSSANASMVNFILTQGKNYESEAQEAAKLALQLQDNNAAIQIFHNLSQYIQEPQQFFYQAIEEGKEEIALELMSIMPNSDDLAISYKGGKSLVQLAVEKGSFKLANALLEKLVKENKHEILHKSDERDNTVLTALYDFLQVSSEQEKSEDALKFAQKFMGYLGTQNANNPLQNETKLCKLSQDLFNNGRTIVHEVARSGNINLMRFIDFVNPAWLTLPDRNGEPPMAYAADSLQLDMVRFLANKTPGDRFGSALQFALNHCSRAGNNQRAETIAINLITRMDVNSLRQERRTKLSENEYVAIPPFVKVLNIGHTQLAELLVTRGAGTLGSHPRSALGVWFNDVADRDTQFRALRRAIVDISSSASNPTITDKCIRQIFTEPKLVGAITTLEQWGQQAANQNKGVFSGFTLFGSKPDSRFVQLMHDMAKYGLHVESSMDVKKYRLPALNCEASIYKEKNGQLHLEHDTRNNTLTLVYTNRDKKESMLGTIHNLTEKNLDFMVPDLAKTLNNIIMAPDNAPKHWNWLRSYEQIFNPQPNSFAIR